MSGPGETPRIPRLLESCLYVGDIERTPRFCEGLLGLTCVGKEANRHVFFRVGPGLLLLFRAEVTRVSTSVPPHGGVGPGHVCLRIPSGPYDPWKRRLLAHGLAIEQEAVRPRGRSFYFRDPDGNSPELAEEEIWPSEAA